MQRIGTVDERFQSYNVEMLEDTPALGRHDRSAGKTRHSPAVGSLIVAAVRLIFFCRISRGE
jgi:hypothetical protein